MNLFARLKNYTGNTPSLFLLAMPYILITFPQIKNAGNFSYLKLFLIIILVLGVDILFRYLFKKLYLKRNLLIYFFYAFYVLFFLFIYSLFFLPVIVEPFARLDVFLRGRVVIFALFAILLTTAITIKNIFQFCNRTLIILCFFILIKSAYDLISLDYPSPKSSTNYLTNPINITHKSKKPIVLIIMDEYASPNIFEKSGIKTTPSNFFNYLDTTGWVIKNPFSTNQTSTIHSISALFNHNIFNSYANKSIVEATEDLNQAAIIKDLHAKNIRFKNYSFFKIYNHPPYKYLYAFADSFTDLILMNTVYLVSKISTNDKVSGLNLNYFATSDYNQDIYNISKSIFDSKGASNEFIYIHLLMPHSPMQYSNEFNLNGYTINNYYKYWLFTNSKMLQLLMNAKNLKNYRIIISGDHGYRGDKKIDAHQTFGAFYGFDKSDLDQIKSVQDLGALIKESFEQ